MSQPARPLIVGLGGSLRERSFSRAALAVTLAIATELGAATELLDVRALDLPIYHPKLALEEYPTAAQASIARLLDVCRHADAMIWSSPTYHGTVSGAFKNALDYLEFLAEDSPVYLHGKPVGLIAVSDATTFAAMIDCVHELQAWLAPTRITLGGRDFDEQMTLVNERAHKRLARLVDELLAFVAKR